MTAYIVKHSECRHFW